MVPLPDVPGATHVVVLENTEQTQTELAMIQQEALLDQAASDIQRIEEKAEYLQERLDGLEAMMSGSRDWNGALAQSLYQDCQRVMVNTFDKPLNAVIGAESFQSKETVEHELIEGVESIKEKAGQFITAAKKFFETLYSSVIGFFKSFFDFAAKQEKRADDIIDKLKTIKIEKLSNEFRLGAWNAYLDVSSGANNLGNGLVMSSKPIYALQHWLTEQNYGNALKSIRAGLVSFSQLGDKKSTKSSDDNTETVQVTLAGMDYILTIPKENPKNAVSALRATKIMFHRNRSAETATHLVGVEKTKQGEALRSYLLKFVELIKRDIQDVRKNVLSTSELEAARKKALAAIDKDDKNQDHASVIRAANQAIINVSKTATKIQVNMLRAGLTYVENHLPGR